MTETAVVYRTPDCASGPGLEFHGRSDVPRTAAAMIGRWHLPVDLEAMASGLERLIVERGDAARAAENWANGLELRKAQISLDDARINGKNSEQRAAQLTLAIACDADYQEADGLATVRRMALASADAALEAQRTRIRLTEAWLRSLA